MFTRFTTLSLFLAISGLFGACTGPVGTESAESFEQSAIVVGRTVENPSVAHKNFTAAYWQNARTTETGPLFSGVFRNEGDYLPLFEYAGADAEIVSEIDANARQIRGTGNSMAVHGTMWIEVYDRNNLAGWTTEAYLTEYVDSASFCEDTEVNDLIRSLSQGLALDSSVLFGLMSPAHGLRVEYVRGGEVLIFDDMDATEMMTGEENHTWGMAAGSGEPVVGTFAELVTPSLLAALTEGTRTCNQINAGPTTAEAALPIGFRNLNHLSFRVQGENEFDWQTWTVTVEYTDGTPYISSIHRLAFES